MKKEELENNYTYHKPKDEHMGLYQTIRESVKNVAELVNDVCPESREKDMALAKLEGAVMWANASIARHL